MIFFFSSLILLMLCLNSKFSFLKLVFWNFWLLYCLFNSLFSTLSWLFWNCRSVSKFQTLNYVDVLSERVWFNSRDREWGWKEVSESNSQPWLNSAEVLWVRIPTGGCKLLASPWWPGRLPELIFWSNSQTWLNSAAVLWVRDHPKAGVFPGLRSGQDCFLLNYSGS